MRRKKRALTAGLLAVGLSTAGLSGGAAIAGVGDEVADGTFAFTAQIAVGDQTSCTGALVAPNWVLTAKSCFPGSILPPDPDNVAPDLPGNLPVTVLVGRTDLTKTAGHRLMGVRVVPSTDRDLALVKLSGAVKDIAPVKLGAAATAGESLRIAGYGRTADQWYPTRLHAGSFTVGSVTGGAIAVQGAGGATLCKGDAGGPALRVDGSNVELVGISSTSWQKGCLGETETRDGESEVRADDLAGWIDSTTGVVPNGGVLPSGVVKLVSGEFTGDANIDLLGVDKAGEAWVFPGRPAHTFGEPTRIGTGWNGYRELAVGKVNRDAHDDIVAIDNSGVVWEYPGNGTGGFTGRVQISTGFTSDFRDFAIGRFNGDAYDDLVGVQTSTSKQIMWPGLAAGGFGSHVETGISGAGWACCKDISAGDFNGDGQSDLVAIDNGTGKLRFWFGNTSGKLTGSSLQDPPGTAWLSRSNLNGFHYSGTGTTGVLYLEGNALVLDPPNATGGIEWNDPIAYGPRA